MSDLCNKFCNKPFDNLEVYWFGQTNMCCPKWLTKPIKHIDGKTSVDEVFNSESAKEIRQSILDGTFEYCDKTLCPHIQNGSLPDKHDITNYRHRKIIDNNIVDDLKPTFYNLSYDDSCNLSCPSCRCTKRSLTEGPVYDQRKAIQDQLIESIFGEPHNRYCLVSITGSGDPFGSKLFRELLFNIDGRNYPRVFVNLQTNGVMFTKKYWDKMYRLHQNINTVIVSIDAGTKETYDIVRRGGNWDQLLENLDLLSSLKANDKINELRFDFCIQKQNYTEMPLMVELSKRYNADGAYFSRIVDWDTFWTGGKMKVGTNTFYKHDIINVDHPEHNDFLDVINSDNMRDDIVDLGNLSEFIRTVEVVSE